MFLFFLPSIIHTLGVLKHQLKSTFNQHSQTYTHVTLFTVYQLKPVFYVMTLCTLFLSLKKQFRKRLVLVLSTQYHTHPGCTQTPIEMKFQSTLLKIHPCNLIHTVSVKVVFYVMTLCTLFLSLKKQFRKRLVLVLSTQYHTHPGCTQTPIEMKFQSTLLKIHPCNLIHTVSVKVVFYVMTLCTLFLSLEKQFRKRLVLVLSTQYHTHPWCTQTPIEMKFHSTLLKIHLCKCIHTVSVKAVFYVKTLCTLFLSLKNEFRQRLVLVFPTQYHTHPGYTQTP